jgi:hypothetical protein
MISLSFIQKRLRSDGKKLSIHTLRKIRKQRETFLSLFFRFPWAKRSTLLDVGDISLWFARKYNTKHRCDFLPFYLHLRNNLYYEESFSSACSEFSPSGVSALRVEKRFSKKLDSNAHLGGFCQCRSHLFCLLQSTQRPENLTIRYAHHDSTPE